MPIFEFFCKKCGQSFEELVFSQNEKISCPKCNSESIEKQLSTFGVNAPAAFPGCAGGACDMANPPAGCAEGCCPGCKH